MVRNRIIAAMCAAALSAFAVANVQAEETITIVAVPSKFTPATITLHRGVTTKLVFAQTQGVHGIQSDDLGIPQTTLEPGKDVSLEVTPQKAGTYVLHCQIVCGEDHANMTLKVIVAE